MKLATMSMVDRGAAVLLACALTAGSGAGVSLAQEYAPAPIQVQVPAKPKPPSSKPAAAPMPAPNPASVASAPAAPAAPATTQSVNAQIAAAPSAAAPSPAAQGAGKPYYIEFRSRSAQSYGHTFSMHGRLNASGKIMSRTVSGLHPVSESPIPWMVGHFVLVPSDTGPSDGDTEDQYVTARFRINLTEAENARLMAYIRDLKAKSPVWHAVLYNCNAFVGDIARFMGMETPSSTMLMPEEYISSLREMNMKRADTSKILGTMVRVEDANKLRAMALREKKGAKPASAATPVAVQNTSGPQSQSW